MGIVVQEICPNCKKKVYILISCPQMRCPHCNDADIINQRKKNHSTPQKEKRRYVLPAMDTKVTTCPKCGTNFTSSSVLTKGKLFCPQCSNPIPPTVR